MAAEVKPQKKGRPKNKVEPRSLKYSVIIQAVGMAIRAVTRNPNTALPTLLVGINRPRDDVRSSSCRSVLSSPEGRIQRRAMKRNFKNGTKKKAASHGGAPTSRSLFTV